MPKRKPKFRASFDPHCPDCFEGWWKEWVQTRHGRVVMAVRRCHCYRVEAVQPQSVSGKKDQRSAPVDQKAAAAGGDR